MSINDLKHRLIPWLLGCSLVANAYLLPTQAQTPRLTDILGVLLGFWVLAWFSSRGLGYGYVFWTFVVFSSPALWLIYAVWSGDLETAVQSFRWLLALPWAITIWILFKQEDTKHAFLNGMWWGVWLNVLVMGLQYFGHIDLTQNLGLAARDFSYSTVRGRFRAPGMFGHPNAAGAITSLSIPISLYFFTRGQELWRLLAAFVAVILAASFGSTRSALVISVIALFIVFIKSINSKRNLQIVTSIFLTGILLVALIGPPGGWDRWLDEIYLSNNLAERLASNLAALRITIQHPLGLGIERAQELLNQNAGTIATHNAFLQAAIIYGVWQGFWMFLTISLVSLRFLLKKRPWRIEDFLGLQLLGLFFFEEHLNNPAFIILFSWLGLSLFQRLFQRIPAQTRAKITSHITPERAV